MAALDGVRGIAILAVLGYHFFDLPGGLYGVDLFFVLSGFLITTLLLEERERVGAISLRRFYMRRGRRLLPALVSLLALVALIGVAVPSWRLAEMLGGSLFYSLNILGAFGHRDVFRGTPVNHLWSLAEEEQFYLLWPAMLGVSLRRVRESRLLPWLLGLFVALVVWRAVLVWGGAGFDRIYFGPDTHADGLVIGCACAIARRSGFTLPTIAGVAGLAALVAAFAAGTISFGWNLLELPVVNLAAAGLVLASLNTGWFSRALALQPLPWLGAISYSLYLWHEFARWLIPGPQPVAEIILATPLALGSYYLIERRFRHRRPTPAPRSFSPTPAPARAPS